MLLYTEEQILEVVNKKDRVLYKRLYDTYYVALCHYASRLLHDMVLEEDVVQEVFLKFWETDTSFNTTRAVTSYLYRSVYNSCLNLIRDRKEIAGDRSVFEQLPVDFNSSDNERFLLEDEYFRQIYVVIDTLSPQRRQVILKTLEGKKIEEIAVEMNISVNTVKTLKKKAYCELREKLAVPVFMLLMLL